MRINSGLFRKSSLTCRIGFSVLGSETTLWFPFGFQLRGAAETAKVYEFLLRFSR